jgi:tetratricopeptide (TPR) repeat protein
MGPYTPIGEGSRSTAEAEALNRRGADLIAEDPDEAERLLREALTKDIFYGPAHNNLGVVYLAQGRLYEAANEFEWARKLLPESADPRINLALCMEQAGRTADALQAYDSALEVAPESLAAMQGAAVLVLRSGRAEPRLDAWLKAIVMRAQDHVWREWAGGRIAQNM